MVKDPFIGLCVCMGNRQCCDLDVVRQQQWLWEEQGSRHRAVRCRRSDIASFRFLYMIINFFDAKYVIAYLILCLLH